MAKEVGGIGVLPHSRKEPVSMELAPNPKPKGWVETFNKNRSWGSWNKVLSLETFNGPEINQGFWLGKLLTPSKEKPQTVPDQNFGNLVFGLDFGKSLGKLS